jgi:hypothetical protein
MSRAKASVRTVSTRGEQKAVGGAAGRTTPVRPVRGTGQTGAGHDRQHFGRSPSCSMREWEES